jgi:hypothetical protein
MTKTLHVAVFLFAACGTLPSQEANILVTNPSNVARSNEPVVVAWSTLGQRIPGRVAGSLDLLDENGKAMDIQVDDLDRDGVPDELTFVADFAPKQQRTFTLRVSDQEKTLHSEGSFRTDAQNWKRVNGVLQSVDDDDLAGDRRERGAYRFDGVGWESEVIAYRLYLDGRNAVDVQGKRKAGLYWKWIGESGVDYQLDADWGMDVLHVGPALGVGGIAFWVGDSVVKPLTLDHQRCRIVARGPVRAVVRIEYRGWDIGGHKVDLASLFTIYAGDRVSEHRILPGNGAGSATLVTGIVKHDSTNAVWEPGGAHLATVGHQSRGNDTLLMALTVHPSMVIRKLEDANNHLLLLTLEEGKPTTVLISSYWQGETGRMWSDEEIASFLTSVARRLAEPLKTTVM